MIAAKAQTNTGWNRQKVRKLGYAYRATHLGLVVESEEERKRGREEERKRGREEERKREREEERKREREEERKRGSE
jgi:hypothetical protein